MSSNAPQIWVEKAQIDEFVDGIFGENRRKNSAAMRKAELILVGAVAYTAYKRVKKARK